MGLIQKSNTAQLTSSERGRGDGSPLSAPSPSSCFVCRCPPARLPARPREGDEGTRLDGEQPPEQQLEGSSYNLDALSSPASIPGCRPLRKEERALGPASQGQVLAFAELGLGEPQENNDVVPFAATWMDPEVIILSPVSQTEKYHVIIAYR